MEARILRIESILKIEPLSPTEEIQESPESSAEDALLKSDRLELQIGQYWFAKAGIVILALGIVFLLTFPYKNLPPVVPSLIGYILTGLIFMFSHFSRRNFEYISKYLFGGALVLLYFSTMRLYYFSANPIVTSSALVAVLLSVVVLIHLYIALKRGAIYLTAIGITMGYVTAVISDNPFSIFLILSALAILVVYLKLKFEWEGLVLFGAVSTYFVHFIWFINNPLVGNKIQLLHSPAANLYFILLYIIIFTCGNLLRIKVSTEDNYIKLSGFITSFGGFCLFLLISLIKFKNDLVIFHLLAALVFLSIAIAFWVREQSKYSTFFYAIIGYTALSVAIIAQFPLPDFFVWLCWQSLIVIITSLWFRSKIIVLANFIIYLILFIFYLTFVGEIGAFTLSYGIVALVSARILNWQKERLDLKTELMRNAYLGVAFIIFPYALYKMLPGGYVAISWLAVAFLYYILSAVLNNKKYRWMAILTILLTIVYVLLVGTTQFDPVFRIISFLLVGFILLIVSIVYAKRKAKSMDIKN